MREKCTAILRRMAAYLKVFARRTALSVLIGLLCGGLGGLFHYVVDLSSGMFHAHGWLLYLLPLAGMAIVWLYHRAGIFQDKGANLVLASLRTGETVPARVAPLIFAGTVLTQLCGGSAGREGAALQIGAGTATCFNRVFHLEGKSANRMTMCGMSALFAAVFGTPITAALFSMEVSAVGVLHYAALYPCLVSSITAWEVSRYMGTTGVTMPAIPLPSPDVGTLFRVLALTLACAAVSILFLEVMHLAGRLYRRFFDGKPYRRAAVGGMLVAAATVLLGTRDYNGAGMEVAVAAVGGQAASWAFLLKILLTALTIGAGYKGGEIVPAFFIGATFGCVAGPWLGLDPGLAAAIGLIALFCSVVNCPVASMLLSVELFGGTRLWMFAVVCGVSYLMSGYSTLYSEQKIIYAKLGEERQ
ncbi:MAG: chloride channel protein [Oscillospiraceae bacterium]|nr:chloride channel protein [Oscillospiraceae bacterium]